MPLTDYISVADCDALDFAIALDERKERREAPPRREALARMSMAFETDFKCCVCGERTLGSNRWILEPFMNVCKFCSALSVRDLAKWIRRARRNRHGHV